MIRLLVVHQIEEGYAAIARHVIVSTFDIARLVSCGSSIIPSVAAALMRANIRQIVIYLEYFNVTWKDQTQFVSRRMPQRIND